MRRILASLLAVAFTYCVYLATIPAPISEKTATHGDYSPRVTREITLSARKTYAACLGSYAEADIARVEAARLAERGAAGCLRLEEGEYVVLGAMYDTEGAARSVCQRLERLEGIEATSLSFETDALRLRVTASESQLDAMENALQFLEETPAELNTLAFQLDDGDIDTAAARALATVINTDAQEVMTRLDEAARGTKDRFCLSLCALMEDISAALDTMTKTEGTTGLMLSSAMKNAAIYTQLGIIDMMALLR